MSVKTVPATRDEGAQVVAWALFSSNGLIRMWKHVPVGFSPLEGETLIPLWAAASSAAGSPVDRDHCLSRYAEAIESIRHAVSLHRTTLAEAKEIIRLVTLSVQHALNPTGSDKGVAS